LLTRIVPHRFCGAGVSRSCHADVCRRRVAATTLLVIRSKLLTLDTLRHGPHRDSVTRAISLRHYCCGAVGQCGRASLLLCGAGGGLAVLELLLCIFCHCAVTCCFGCAAVDLLPRLLLSSSKERCNDSRPSREAPKPDCLADATCFCHSQGIRLYGLHSVSFSLFAWLAAYYCCGSGAARSTMTALLIIISLD
jgi:hypothetical protein